MPGVRVAEAEVSPGEIQDLAERIGDILRETVGKEIKFQVRMALSSIEASDEGIVARVNAILQQVSDRLRFR